MAQRLTNPGEIAEFVRDFVRRRPDIALPKVRLAVETKIAPGTRDAWLEAIATAKRRP